MSERQATIDQAEVPTQRHLEAGKSQACTSGERSRYAVGDSETLAKTGVVQCVFRLTVVLNQIEAGSMSLGHEGHVMSCAEQHGHPGTKAAQQLT